MTPPPQPIVAFPFTGDYRVDTLLEGLQYRWNRTAPLGSPVEVTYSFMTAKPSYGGTDMFGATGFSPFTEAQKAAVREIMSRLDAALGISIREVPDFSFSYGQIRFGNNSQFDTVGYSWLPYSTNDDRGGDVWIDRDSPGTANPAKGSFEWAALLHEIGHALGLKHPGNYESEVFEPGNWLGVLEDNANYTVMSYLSPAGGQERDWFGMYDLLALRTLYGSGDVNPGDTTYQYTDADGRILGIIDDAWGFDTMDLSSVSIGATVDLRPGAFSSVSRTSGFFGLPARDNLSISLSTVIEKFIGTAYDDSVTGNDAANQFFLGTGVNIANGLGGLDIANYGLARAAYQVTLSGGTWRVSGDGVNDTLMNIERLAFTDRGVAADGHAEVTAKILGAVFGSETVRGRPEYAGIGIRLLDDGMSYADLVKRALDAHLGAGFSDAAEVELLYRNLVGTQPSAADVAFYTAAIANGTFTQATLGVFAAEHALNTANIDLVGLASTGLAYVG